MLGWTISSQYAPLPMAIRACFRQCICASHKVTSCRWSFGTGLQVRRALEKAIRCRTRCATKTCFAVHEEESAVCELVTIVWQDGGSSVNIVEATAFGKGMWKEVKKSARMLSCRATEVRVGADAERA